MAVEFTTLANTITDGGTSITLNLTDPTTQAGDQLFAFIYKDDDTATTTQPLGWQVLRGLNAGTMRGEIYFKYALSTDTNSSYTWEGDSETYVGIIIRVTGAENYNTARHKEQTSNTSSQALTEYTPLDTAPPKRWWLHGGGGDNGTMASKNNDTTSVTEAQNLTGTGSGDIALRVYSKDRETFPINTQYYSNIDERWQVLFIITLYEESASENIADGDLTSTVSTLSGTAVQVIDGEIVINGNLTSTVSTLSGTAENTPVTYDYVLELFSNILKSTAVLESLRFTATINDIEAPLIGFTIRSKLVNLNTEISNISEIRVFLSDSDIETFVPLIDTATVIIKSIYNFGSTDVETALFTGILSDIQKQTYSDWSNIISRNNETSSGGGSHIIDKPILISTTMARLAFDHTIKPNDYVVLDGSSRKISKVISYNYLDKGAFSEVHYG